MNKPWIKPLCTATLSVCFALAAPAVWAQSELPAPVQAKADSYKQKLVEWAANPAIVAAAKAANAKGPVAGMTNGKWNDLDESDPVVKGYQSNPAGVQIGKWEADKNINKLVLRDEKGNLVAASMKPVIYNNAARPPFVNAMKGQAWTDKQIKPDPSSGVKSVQASAPVMDGGKVIGVLHAGVSAD